MKRLGPWYWHVFVERMKMLSILSAILYVLFAVTMTARTNLIPRFGGFLQIPSAERNELIALNLGALLIMMLGFTLAVPVTYLVTLYHRYHDQEHPAPHITR